MNQSLPQLLKQHSYWETVSVWKIGEKYLEITQTSDGRYLLTHISEEELEQWDKNDNFCYGLSQNCAKIGEPANSI